MNPASDLDLLPGFKVVPKRNLQQMYRPSQTAYYVLIGRRGAPDAPRQRVVLVECLDEFLEGCQQQIAELWEKHRILVTHVAVKIGRRLGRRHELSKVYERAITVQRLRRRLHPRLRRV